MNDRVRLVSQRFLARQIDVAIVLILISELYEDHLIDSDIIIFLIAHVVLVPLETLQLFFFSCTIGKKLVGLEVEFDEQTFICCFNRSWRVLVYGLGLGIPVLSFFFCLYNFNLLNDGKNTSWDLKCKSKVQRKLREK